MRNVAIGPKKRDTSHQLKPLLPFVCARPAFMRERVNQPTAYSPVSRIIFKLLEASGRQPESLRIRNDAYAKMPVLITPGITQKRKTSHLRCSRQNKVPARVETPRRSRRGGRFFPSVNGNGKLGSRRAGSSPRFLVVLYKPEGFAARLLIKISTRSPSCSAVNSLPSRLAASFPCRSIISVCRE